MIKTALIEPAILDIFTRIFITYKAYISIDSKEKIKRLINAIIKSHCPVKHSFEISWALWIAKTFEIKIEEQSANSIIETRDSVSNLILLDLINNSTLVKGHPRISDIEAELKDDILMSENWLLAYEGVKKGWLTPIEMDLLDKNLFFKILKDKDIEFYKTTKQLKTYISKEGQKDETLITGQQTTQISEQSNQATQEVKSEQMSELIDLFISGLYF